MPQRTKANCDGQWFNDKSARCKSKFVDLPVQFSTGVAGRSYCLLVHQDFFLKSMYDFNFTINNGGMKIAYMVVEILIPS